MIQNFREHHEEARRATRYLIEEVIPKFAKKLDAHQIIAVQSHQITTVMHEHGINLRFAVSSACQSWRSSVDE